MAFRPVGSVLRYLRADRRARDGGELTDGQLLQRFVDRGDEGAFETLVLRHGGTVLGVCRRVLGHEQDAEDAFQATFLVLARKAASIGSRETVGNWLYGVAYRTARKAKVTNARRRNRETQAANNRQQKHDTKEVWSDLQPLLDRELQRLPAKYRSPLVLCDLEGKTRAEAARQLGWPEGTLSWRLAAARSLLAKRLQRHGVTLSAGALGLVLAQNASAGVPAQLIASTINAAGIASLGQAVAAGLIPADVAALTEGVLRTMFCTKLKIAGAICLTLAVMATGAGVVSYRVCAGPGQRAQTAARADKDGQAFVAFAEDRGREPRKPADVAGPITAISADGKVLTVRIGGGGRGEEPKVTEVTLSDKTNIEFVGAGKDLKRKLKVGDAVAVSLEGGAPALVQVHSAADLSGNITAVSADGKTVTLEAPSRIRGEAPRKVAVKITDKTQMVKPATRGGEDVEAEKPIVGLSASVWLVEGSKDVAGALQVHKPGKPGNRR